MTPVMPERLHENATPPRDHGGNLSAAMAEFGGSRNGWMDLSTGINPHPYPLPEFTAGDWGRCRMPMPWRSLRTQRELSGTFRRRPPFWPRRVLRR